MKYYLVRIAYKILNRYLHKKYLINNDVNVCKHTRNLQDILVTLDCLKIKQPK